GDGCKVVQPAASVSFGDQGVDLPGRLGAGHQKGGDAPVVDHAGESVAGDQEHVADPYLAAIYVGFDLGTRADTPRDHVAVRVVARLLRREKAGVDLLLHVRVVLRDLLERPVAQQ